MADEFALPGIVNTDDLEKLKAQLGVGWDVGPTGQNQQVRVTATPQPAKFGPTVAGVPGPQIQPATTTQGWAQFIPYPGGPGMNLEDTATGPESFAPYTRRQPTAAQEARFFPERLAVSKAKGEQLADLGQLERMLTQRMTAAPPSDLTGQILHSKMQSDSITQLGQIEQLKQYITSGGLPPKPSTASPEAQDFSTYVTEAQARGMSGPESIHWAMNKINANKTGAAAERTTAIGMATLPIKAAAAAQQQQLSMLDDPTVNLLAETYIKTGQMPAFGIGMGQARKQILDRVGQIASRQGMDVGTLLAGQAGWQANKAELTRLQQQRGPVMAFAETADKNLALAQSLSGNVDRTGSPVVNRWLLAGRRSILGDPDVSRFDAALRTAINEYAKVTSSASAGGQQTSDVARKEIEDMLNSAQTPEQINGVVNILQQEIQNRREGYETQIEHLNAALSGQKKQTPSAPITPKKAPRITNIERVS